MLQVKNITERVKNNKESAFDSSKIRLSDFGPILEMLMLLKRSKCVTKFLDSYSKVIFKIFSTVQKISKKF